jgi:uncharacterized protein YdeI (YjbR/CyaY-like superfamily)
MLERWNNLTPGRRRSQLYQLNTAKTHATRSKRIAKLVAELKEATVGR